MLQKTNRFQSDVKKYSDTIDQIVDEKEKLEAKRLLSDLIHAVKNMDNMYLDMVYAKQLPSMGKEMRDKIIDIRKELESKIKKNTAA